MSQEIKTSVLQSAKAHLNLLLESGVDFVPKTGTIYQDSTMPKKESEKNSNTSTAAKSSVCSALPITDPDLLALRQEIGDCTRCPLAPTRTNIVFGEGDPRAKIMFVGEAPGADEDASGRPFVGRAGKLLTDMIEKGMGIPRSAVYIANICKCRPPENRNPEPIEITNCSPFLKKQIEIISPKVIIALGKFAAQTLLKTETPITKLRGLFHDYGGVQLMPTYHPAYLLRNPIMKKAVWEDLQIVMRHLGMGMPKK